MVLRIRGEPPGARGWEISLEGILLRAGGNLFRSDFNDLIRFKS